MNKAQAIAEVKKVFSQHHAITQNEDKWLAGLVAGKLYELFCLSKTLERLRLTYGYRLQFHGSSIVFQASPGHIDRLRPYFSVFGNSNQPTFELFTDVEFGTLGQSRAAPMPSDLSGYHEIDILVVDFGANGRPSYDEIALGVECKSHANFKKSIVKEVLGIRREMTLLNHPLVPSRLALASPGRPPIQVPADPASEYWLAFTDSKGLQYQRSPAQFGITFEHWEP